MQELLFILVTILQIAIGIIASIAKLTKDNNSQYPLNLTIAGWLLMLGVIFCIGLNISLYYVNDSQKNQFEAKLDLRDSINKRHIDSIQFQTVEKLAKYGLKIDSNKNEIIANLNDSLKRKTIIINGEDPYFNFYLDSAINIRMLNNDDVKMKINFCNYHATSKNINATIYVIGINNGKFILIGKPSIVRINSSMNKDEIISVSLNYFESTTEHVIQNKYYFYLKGTYFNSDLTKKFDVDQIAGFDMQLMANVNIFSKIENDIKEFIKPLIKK